MDALNREKIDKVFLYDSSDNYTKICGASRR